MAQEIERKFLVHDDRVPRDARTHGAAFTQGYLAFTPAVRVRLARHDDGREEAWLTIKGKGAISRAEYEYAVPPDDAREMLGLCAATLSKVRYHVRVGAHTWDLDEFTGAHAGLWLAEVELKHVDETFDRPAWLGHEVTDDARYTNSALARAGRAP